MALKTLIVSAADKAYFPLLQDLITSIKTIRQDLAIGILDVGLSDEQYHWLSGQINELKKPGWDLQVSAISSRE